MPEDAPGVAPSSAEPRAPDEDSLRLAEALIFASADPVPARTLQRLLPDDLDAEFVLAVLREHYAGRGVELVDAAGGVMFRTAPDIAPRLRKVVEVPRRLPRVAMETLAIIAYHQPVTRPEIEHIRGSALSQQTLDSLLELNLIAPKGRRETPGRPTLWGTTPDFLAHFGLKDLRELPRREDLLLDPVPPRPETVTPDLRTPERPAPAVTAEAAAEHAVQESATGEGTAGEGTTDEGATTDQAAEEKAVAERSVSADAPPDTGGSADTPGDTAHPADGAQSD
jgi:segregation and condensation protein B